MAISAKEIAEKLNISAATVSMVLNNKPGISEATRKKVIDAAHKYGFDFSKLENKTFSGIIQLIIYKKHGMVVTDTPFFSHLLEGIEQCCREKNFSLQIKYFYENDTSEQQTDDIQIHECDGILLLGTEMQLEDFKYFKSVKDIPIVVLDTYFDCLDYDFVTINNTRGTFNSTEYLISQGFTDIGYLRSSYEIANFSERFDGYCKAMKKYNLAINSDHIHYVLPTADGAYNDMKKISVQSLTKAYIADNDLIAAGMVHFLKEQGMSIPDDVSVIGFDNMPFCDIIEPGLSTLDVKKHEFGTAAVNQLINRIQNLNSSFCRIQLSPTLRIRKSVNLTI